jgi:urocanate hydratase
MRGATWVSLHNGGGTGWGKAINGGFGLVLDGTAYAEERAKCMLFYDVTNGLTRRARAGNVNAIKTIKRLQDKYRYNENDGYFPFIPSI